MVGVCYTRWITGGCIKYSIKQYKDHYTSVSVIESVQIGPSFSNNCLPKQEKFQHAATFIICSPQWSPPKCSSGTIRRSLAPSTLVPAKVEKIGVPLATSCLMRSLAGSPVWDHGRSANGSVVSTSTSSSARTWGAPGC